MAEYLCRLSIPRRTFNFIDMKKLFILLLLLCLTSCGKTEVADKPVSYDKYKMVDLPNTAYYLGEDTVAFYPYENKFYKIGDEAGVFDILDGMNYTRLCDINDGDAHDIFVDSDGIYIYAGNTVKHLGFDGNTVAQYELPSIEGVSRNNLICASEKYIFVLHDSMLDGSTDAFIYSINKDSGEFKASDVTNKDVAFEFYRMFEPGREANEVMILSSRKSHELSYDDLYETYVFNADKGIRKQLAGYEYTIYGADYIAENNAMHIVLDSIGVKSEGVIQLSVGNPEAGDFSGSRQYDVSKVFSAIRSAVENENREVKYLSYTFTTNNFATGYDYIMWDKKNHTAFVFDQYENIGGETLTVLHPKVYNSTEIETDPFYVSSFINNGLDEATILPIMQFELDNNVKVNTKFFELSEFSERLRMKLLAGERDYDIVYLDNADRLLPYLLKYSLYLPLEEYSGITESFGNYIDGVRDIMSFDGHIYGVPYNIQGYSMAVNYDSQQSGMGIPELSEKCTVEEFWSLCESVRQKNDETVVTVDFRFFIEVMQNIIEDGVADGKIDREKVKNFISDFMKYSEAGLLTQKTKYSEYLFDNIFSFVETGRSSGFEKDNRDIRAYPSFSGKQYYTVKSMIYANSLTQNKENSVKYLAMLLSDKFGPEEVIHKTCLWKNSAGYFTYEFNGMDFFSKSDVVETENAYEWIKQPSYFDETVKAFFEAQPHGMKNAAPRLYSGMMEEIIDIVFDELMSGSITPDEAADRIVNEANYRIME